jgi:hypothetical protein
MVTGQYDYCYIVVCPFILFLLVIELSVLRYTNSDLPLWYLQTLLTPIVSCKCRNVLKYAASYRHRSLEGVKMSVIA